METATLPVPATLVSFLERRRAGSVPPRGMVFVERRRPAPVLVVEADDLHAPDAELVLADALDYGFGTGAYAPLGAALLLDALSSRSALCSAVKAMAGGASLYWAAHAAAAPVDPLADLAPDQLVELGRS